MNRPELLPENVFYYEAFWEVSSDRQIGMGIGDIPFSAIDRYAIRYGVSDVDRFDVFRRVMRAMDAEYRKLTAPPDKNKTRTASAKDPKAVAAMLGRMSERAGSRTRSPLKVRRQPKPEE